MADRDIRYSVIKPMYKEGRIKTFSDIFIYIPKTVVAGDLGKKVARFSAQLSHLENFDLSELFLIGNLCDLTRTQMLKLMTMEFAIIDKETMPGDETNHDSKTDPDKGSNRNSEAILSP